MKKMFISLISTVVFLFLLVSPAFAHVVVRPAEVGVGSRQSFVVSVPTEEDTPTTRLRLVIPEGLKSVRPNVKPGWSIELVKVGEGEAARVSEIIWSGGRIPAEQRDEFVFSAQAPAQETALAWKAYQTYASGSVVAWDSDPKTVEEYTKNNPPVEGGHDDNAPKPYSMTKVINDLKPSPAGTTAPIQMTANESHSGSVSLVDLSRKMNLFMVMSGGALLLSVVALFLSMNKSNKK